MSDLCSLNNSLDAIGDVKALIVRSINFSYFLWPKSNKKTCRKKGDFCFAKPRMILGINNAPGKQDLKDLLYTNSLEASNHRYR